jgi:LPS-assembly lipoprotein
VRRADGQEIAEMLHRNLMIIALALLLGACGFQLRGSGTQTFALTEIDLQARDAFGETARQLEDLLTNSGVRVHAGAPYQLVLLDEQQSQRTASFNSAARSAEYELNTSLAYQIRTQQLPLLENRLEAQKIYAVDQNNLVGSEQEREQLTQEMRRDLVQQLARRLQALTPAQLDRLRRDAEAKAAAEAEAQTPPGSLPAPTEP